ncbi:MAG TPA: response regulator [Candidatus Dormibacteraeota bacterium]|nr:response regulator [Candidatus Dormibacteraeota bacterium]
MTSPLVLLVEDNETNQMLTMAVLMRDGYRVTAASTADEALSMMRSERPDIILMDLQLPGQDGLALTRTLKLDPATAAIPVVAMTAHVMMGDEAQALAAGCAGYIAKPIDTRTLADEIRRYLVVAP